MKGRKTSLIFLNVLVRSIHKDILKCPYMVNNLDVLYVLNGKLKDYMAQPF